MQRHLVPRAVTQRVAEAKPSGKRKTYDDKTMRDVCDYARYHSVARAAARYNIVQSCVSRWFSTFKKSGYKEYPKGKQRGRAPVLSAKTEAEVEKLMDMTRNGPKEQLSARLVSAYAQGVIMKNNGALLKENGGTLVLGCQWAKRFMKRRKWGIFSRTTTRTVSASVVVAAAPEFFGRIQAIQPVRSLLFNIDEFFVLLSGKTSSWTWHRVSESRRVPLRDTTVGCTMAVLTSADGVLHKVQLIWSGKTERSHAEVDTDHEDRWIVQFHNGDTHFQNAESWNKFLRESFVPIVRRCRSGSAENEPACLIADAAP